MLRQGEHGLLRQCHGLDLLPCRQLVFGGMYTAYSKGLHDYIV